MVRNYRSFLGTILCVSLLLCSVYISSPVRAYAEDKTEAVYTVMAESSLRLRSGPGTKYETLTFIPTGTEITISEIESNWGKTSYNNKTGWVSMGYVAAKQLFSGVYMIIPKCAPTSALDVCDWGTEDGTNLQIWEITGGENQLFSVVSVGDGYYQLTSIHSKKVIDVSRGSDESGANVQMWTENDTDAQKWLITAKEDNYYTLTAKCSNLALDVSNALTNNGTNVHQWTPNDSDAQLFYFKPVYVENPDIYIKQAKNNTCTLASATMVLRKAAELKGQDYTVITEEAVGRIAWAKGLRNDFVYNGMKLTSKSIRDFKTIEEKKEYLIKMLQLHPEGLVVYDRNKPHAITLCYYDDISDTFYVADPWGNSEGCVPLIESTIRGKTQDDKLQRLTTIWYIWAISE